jgi:hypothetical protein
MEIIVGIVFAFAGALCLFLTVLLMRRSILRLRDWGSTTGRVVGYDESNRAGRCFYRPRVEFTARDGRTVVFSASTGSNRRAYRVGASVKVLVDPAHPDCAELRSFSTLWLLPSFLTLFGLTFLGIGVSAVLGWIN